VTQIVNAAIDALAADRDALLAICEGLTDDRWAAPSGCPGWTVQDVVAHMDAIFWLVVDPSTLPDTSGLPAETAQDHYVDARRSWTAQQVVDDYRSVSTKALDALKGLASQDFEVPLGDIGTYPAALIPNAYTFDHYTHIRADLFPPRGPLAGDPPPTDEFQLAPVLDWIEAALPQQNSSIVASLPGTIDLVVTAPAPRTIRIGAGSPLATVTSEGAAFVRWITQRGAWDALGVEGSGDQEALSAARSLRVF
jgi:uncharacterized protein (TIGR03083 family)